MKKEPYKVGTKVKYLGKRQASKSPHGMINPKESDYTTKINPNIRY